MAAFVTCLILSSLFLSLPFTQVDGTPPQRREQSQSEGGVATAPKRRSAAVVGAHASNRIHNGIQSASDAYPFFAQMWWNGIGQGCGGTLIASRWILTAAHCVEDILEDMLTDGYPQWRVGSYCLLADNCGAPHQVMLSKRGILHPRFDRENLVWDYALVELQEEASAPPVHLDEDGKLRDSLETGQGLRAIGMGFVDMFGTVSSHLMEVDNLYLSSEICAMYFSNGAHFDESILCTNGEGFGVCAGDSGSPVLRNDPDPPHHLKQVSLTSFGAPHCGDATYDYPDVSAPVAAAMPWIQDTVCPYYVNPSQEPNRPHYCASHPCQDGTHYFVFKKEKFRECSRIQRPNQVKKACKGSNSNALQICQKTCGLCS